MKITLNLSPAESARDRYALSWGIPATLIGLAALILLGRASLREYHDYLGIESQLLEVQKRTVDLRNQEVAIRKKLEDPVYSNLLVRARFVNKLIDQKELSLTGLSARLAGLLPEDAHLTGLALTSPKKPGDDYTVRLGITAKSEDAVETFINDLEDSPDFKDVAITNEGFQEQSTQGQQINLICTARYLPGAEKELEEGNQAPEASNQKSEASPPAPGVKSQKAGGKTQALGVGSQKLNKGAKNSRAQEPTSNSKPNH